MARATKAEKEERVGAVFQLLLKGHPRAQIIHYIVEQKEWCTTTRQAENYLKQAYDLFKKEAKNEREGEYGKAISRLNRLYEKAYDNDQFKVCLNIQKEINKLFKLYDDDVGGEVDGFEGFVFREITPEEAEELRSDDG